MGTKVDPGIFDCHANAEPDEPMFVLLGRDPHAHAAVRKWADDREQMIRAGLKPAEDIYMVYEARQCADAMEVYCIARAKAKKEAAQDFLERLEKGVTEFG